MLQVFAFVITLTIYLTGSLAVVQGAAWARDQIEAKRRPSLKSVPPALWRCLGLGSFFIGMTFHRTQLAVIGALLVALSLLLETPDSPKLNQRLEYVVLQLSLASLLCLAVARFAG